MIDSCHPWSWRQASAVVPGEDIYFEPVHECPRWPNIVHRVAIRLPRGRASPWRIDQNLEGPAKTLSPWFAIQTLSWCFGGGNGIPFTTCTFLVIHVPWRYNSTRYHHQRSIHGVSAPVCLTFSIILRR